MERLTLREVELCECIASGYTDNEIANEFNIASESIYNYKLSICRKLKIKDTTKNHRFVELAKWCKRNIKRIQ